MLNSTVEGILKGLVTNNHEEHHLARIAILTVPGIGGNTFSVKSATKKGIVSIFDFDNPVWSGLSADSHGGEELAMNAMTNAQLWHRRLGHLNKRILELVQRRDGNRVVFDGSIDHFDVCAVRKSHQLAHPKKVTHAGITAPFQLVYGNLMGPFKPAVREG